MIRCLFLLAIANHSLTFVWPSFKVLRLYFQLGNSALRNQTRTKTPWRDQLAIQCNVYSSWMCANLSNWILRVKSNHQKVQEYLLWKLNFTGPTSSKVLRLYFQLDNSALRKQTGTKTPWREHFSWTIIHSLLLLCLKGQKIFIWQGRRKVWKSGCASIN